MWLKEAREAIPLTQREAANLIGIDEPLLSKMEHFRCLPTVYHFRQMCKAYDKKPSDLYSFEEVDLFGLNCPRSGLKSSEGTEGYKLTVRLLGEQASSLNEKLNVCGYEGKTDWIKHCLKNLDRQYKRKTASTSAKVKAANINTQVKNNTESEACK